MPFLLFHKYDVLSRYRRSLRKVLCTNAIRGQCYDHYFCDFRQFSAKKLAFPKKSMLLWFLAYIALIWVKNYNVLSQFFGENILKIITLTPETRLIIFHSTLNDLQLVILSNHHTKIQWSATSPYGGWGIFWSVANTRSAFNSTPL
jgi:hypothetical protein